MIIEFDKTIFDSTDSNDVNFLLRLCTYRSRYEICVELTNKIQNSLIFKALNYDDQQMLTQVYNVNVQSQSNYVADYVVCETPSTDNELNIAEAIRFLIQPVSIVLENSKHDSYFLKVIFKHFDNNGEVLRHLVNGWVQFENAGGCDNIINFLTGKMQSFNNLSKDNKRFPDH